VSQSQQKRLEKLRRREVERKWAKDMMVLGEKEMAFSG